MVPRERVLTALAHEEPDRVPIDLWMTPEVEAELIRLTGVEDPFAMRVEAGHDLLMSSVGMVSSFYMSQENEYVDPWGIRFARTSYSHGAGSYTEIVGHPLAGDDVGTQDRMLVSPALWREFVKPRYGRLFSAYKLARPGLKIAVHICGFIEPVIDDLIEVGVDILNPVQPLAMDPGRLKRRYGHRLSFWGAVDDQKVLPLGSPRDVQDEVRLRLGQLAPGGGYILCPSHNVQPTTPMENIRAFYRAAERYRGYPLRV
jgi:uroporphyrinogen-III decarboxylase